MVLVLQEGMGRRGAQEHIARYFAQSIVFLVFCFRLGCLWALFGDN